MSGRVPKGVPEGGQFSNQINSEADVSLTSSRGITPIQRKVATGFFSLSQSKGFFLCGGAALIASGDVDRNTEDLDLFTRPGSGIQEAATALSKWCEGEGLDFRYLRQYEQFARIQITAPDGSTTLVDLAEDAEPKRLMMTPLGPAPSTEDAATRKLLALYGRMEARDYADVYDLSRLVSKNDMAAGAREMDQGFDIEMLIGSIAMIRRLDDGEIPHRDPAAVRKFFESWIVELQEG